jgi:hypothetical protein
VKLFAAGLLRQCVAICLALAALLGIAATFAHEKTKEFVISPDARLVRPHSVMTYKAARIGVIARSQVGAKQFARLAITTQHPTLGQIEVNHSWLLNQIVYFNSTITPLRLEDFVTQLDGLHLVEVKERDDAQVSFDYDLAVPLSATARIGDKFTLQVDNVDANKVTIAYWRDGRTHRMHAPSSALSIITLARGQSVIVDEIRVSIVETKPAGDQRPATAFLKLSTSR